MRKAANNFIPTVTNNKGFFPSKIEICDPTVVSRKNIFIFVKPMPSTEKQSKRLNFKLGIGIKTLWTFSSQQGILFVFARNGHSGVCVVLWAAVLNIYEQRKVLSTPRNRLICILKWFSFERIHQLWPGPTSPTQKRWVWWCWIGRNDTQYQDNIQDDTKYTTDKMGHSALRPLNVNVILLKPLHCSYFYIWPDLTENDLTWPNPWSDLTSPTQPIQPNPTQLNLTAPNLISKETS